MKRHARVQRPKALFAPMQVDDIDAVVSIELDSFTMPWTAAMFRSELQNERTSRLLVARMPHKGDIIVGYLAYRIVLDEMHIILLAVAPAWRQQGIARQMLGVGIGEARDAGCLRATLEVRVSNTPAQQLYYGLQFAPVGTRPKYYMQPTEDAMILWRDPL